MLSAAIVTFREVIEAALIIGLVLTATRGIVGRGAYVAAGVAAGILGAGVLALFADLLAQAAEGVGPELFNAGVLLAAATMLAWHNVWMTSHGRALARDMRAVGAAVGTGARPVYALAIVVALAVLREGVEVVLFLYGIAVSGTNTVALFLGSLLGVTAGAAVGAALYLGLVRIPARYLFSIVAALLVFLAAGMAAQASAYLSQAGWLPTLTSTLWDSSAILPEHSVVGGMLHTLVGYVDRPSGIQLAAYVATAVIVGGLTLAAHKQSARKPAYVVSGLVLVALASLVSVRPAHAGAEIGAPIVKQGATGLEQHGRTILASHRPTV
jgi:high-affinity iron transporter